MVAEVLADLGEAGSGVATLERAAVDLLVGQICLHQDATQKRQRVRAEFLGVQNGEQVAEPALGGTFMVGKAEGSERP